MTAKFMNTRPDSSLRYRRYINHLLTYLLNIFNVPTALKFQNFVNDNKKLRCDTETSNISDVQTHTYYK